MKLEADTLEVKTRDRSNSNSSSRSKSQLPCGVGTGGDNRWSEVFVPTYMSYLGSLSEPWHPDIKKTLKAVQMIWDAVYPDRPHEVKSASDKAFSIVSLTF